MAVTETGFYENSVASFETEKLLLIKNAFVLLIPHIMVNLMQKTTYLVLVPYYL